MLSLIEERDEIDALLLDVGLTQEDKEQCLVRLSELQDEYYETDAYVSDY